MNFNLNDILYDFQVSNFFYDLEQLKRAYVGACHAPRQDRKKLDESWENFKKEVAAGHATMSEQDPDDYFVDYEQDMAEAVDETEGALRYTREAFTMALHHLWERHLRRLSRKKEYDQDEAFKFLKSKGKSPDEVTLNTLRLAANAAKHDKGPSAKNLFRKRPDMFDQTRSRATPYVANYDDMRITESEVDKFFSAAEAALR